MAEFESQAMKTMYYCDKRLDVKGKSVHFLIGENAIATNARKTCHLYRKKVAIATNSGNFTCKIEVR